MGTTLTLAVSRRAKERSSLVQLSNNNNKKRKRRMASPGKQVAVGAAAIIAAVTGGYFYAKRKEAVPLPGPIGGGSLSSWKEPEAAGNSEEKKEKDGNLNLGSADDVPTKLKEPAAAGKPEDEKKKDSSQPAEKKANLNISSAKDNAN